MADATAAPAPCETVDISCTDGTIHIHAPSIFTPDDAWIHALIERAFGAPCVQSVFIDRAHSTIDIRYDSAASDRESVLRTLSVGLRSCTNRDESLIRQYLGRVPGRVKRVERRLPEPATAGDRQTAAHVSALMVENLIVEYDPVPAGAALEAGRSLPAGRGELPADVTRPWVGEVVVGGVRRIINLTAAGGCLIMSVVGVVTPGIPTVPFVLATGYFLARSSPRLHARFRKSPVFGRMVSEYEDCGGLRWTTKVKAILLTLGLMAVTVMIAGAALPLLVIMAIMGGIGILIVSRLPTISTGRAPEFAPAPA